MIPSATVADDAIASLRAVMSRILRSVEHLSLTTYWRIRTTLLLTTGALFVAFPSLDAIDRGSWNAVERIGRHPFAPLRFPPGSHESKMIFRVTVPILGDGLGLGPYGYLALQALFGVLLIFCLLTLLERATGDRVVSIVLTGAAVMTYGGCASFVETRGMFDGVALTLLLLALISSRPLLSGLLVFLAGWTDERALLASGFLVAYLLYERSVRRDTGNESAGPVAPGSAGSDFDWRVAAVAAAIVLYLASRIAVTALRHLPQDNGGIGLRVLLDQVNNIPVGLWTGLEGLWMVVALGTYVMWRQRIRHAAAVMSGTVAVIAIAAVSVVDISRGMAYLLPSVVVAALVLHDTMSTARFRRLSLLCLAVSAIWPIYYVGGSHSIGLYYPFPLEMARLLTGVGG
ncbi:MAG: hypothetical protein R2698_14475 [Microthrixaceae bacterium]